MPIFDYHSKKQPIQDYPYRVVSQTYIEALRYTVSPVDRCPWCGYTPTLWSFTCKCGKNFIHWGFPKQCVHCRRPWNKIKCMRCEHIMERIWIEGKGEAFLGPQKPVNIYSDLYWLSTGLGEGK